MLMKNLLSIMCFVLALRFCVVAAKTCGYLQHFTPNGTYDIYRRLILSSLASNVGTRDGFYNVSVGEGSERIYALGLCVPGTDPKVCSDCIQSASIDLLQNCPNQTDSFDWRGDSWRGDKTLCFVRYSNYSFFESVDLEPNDIQSGNEDITGNVTDLNIIWEDFMERMIAAASFSTPGSPAGRHYAAGMTPWTRFINIYVVMQCIPGLSSTECDSCLRANVRTFEECCSGKIGAGIENPVCYFRWNFFTYFGLFDNITSPPPPPLQSLQGPPQSILPPANLPNTTKKDAKSFSIGTLVTILVVAAIILALFALGFAFCWKRKSNQTKKLKIDDDITSPESLQFDFKTLQDATDKFSGKNKIGQGGFGEVYRGTFPDGTEIAVKRLSRNSGQGLKEFKNEVAVVAKLQHRNLVRLLGFCLEGEEQILVYEFVSNKSLDHFLFDPVKKEQLDWTKRYHIIGGITRGILYLHQDSRLKIIHRDLKASNILLDDDMNPKIADFGMARIFGMEQTRASTSKIAGTFGYMAPEYVMHGQFSIKSDVYSFGVLVLEIICGITNSSFYQTDESAGNLVTHAWKLWRKGLALELLDPTLGEYYQRDEVTRCIHIALLCVQEDPGDRPTMSTIILMFSTGSTDLPVPNEPRLFLTELKQRS